jgi:hypothetical protein
MNDGVDDDVDAEDMSDVSSALDEWMTMMMMMMMKMKMECIPLKSNMNAGGEGL